VVSPATAADERYELARLDGKRHVVHDLSLTDVLAHADGLDAPAPAAYARRARG
jgi:hypothetical protein